jgi:spermidine/putrescine transport system permease protein
MSLVVYFAFTDKNGNFSLSNLNDVFLYSNVFLRSIWLGFIATSFCFLIGYPTAYIISRVNIKCRKFLIAMIMLPMWTNFLLKTYAWMTILEERGFVSCFFQFLGIGKFSLINTSSAVVFGMVYNFITYMILPIYSVLIRNDRHLVEAAQDLGANQLKIFLKVTFPLSLPGVIAGIAMVFVPSVSTFVLSKMLGGGKDLLIGDIIDMQFLGSVYNPCLGSAISLVLMILVFICSGIMNQFVKREERTVIAL